MFRNLVNGLLALAGAIFPQRSGAAAVFTQPCSPQEGLVAPPERPWRDEVCLNASWQFQPMAVPEGFKPGKGEPPALPMPSPKAWERTYIKIPSPWNVNAWGNGRKVGAGSEHPFWPDSVYFPSYPASWEDARMGWLRRFFKVPKSFQGKRLILHFDAVAGQCDIYVNGKKAGEHFDSYIPFEVDITNFIRPDSSNELMLGVRHHELFDLHHPRFHAYRKPYPQGSSTEKLIGIWQDVFLVGLPALRVDDVFVKPLVAEGVLELEIKVRNDSGLAQTAEVGGEVHPWQNLAGADALSAPVPKWSLGPAVLNLSPQAITVQPGQSASLVLRQAVKDELKPWSPDQPNLCGLVLKVKANGQDVDARYQRFGWRQVTLAGRELHLNGSKIQLFSDICHPFGPYMMSRRFAWAWFRMIKDFNGNSVRPHAQPYPHFYMDLADEMGLMVLDEAALFGSSINMNLEEPIAWQRFDEHYDGLILRDRNHPSVFGWSFSNEMFTGTFDPRMTQPEKDSYYHRLREYGLRERKLDPTREWISSDGDEDLGGAMPVWVKHLGHGLRELPHMNKPMAVGESGGTYYAKPGQLAEFNGERAYESYLLRNEALGIDVYQNVVKMALPHLAYYCASETIWFGLEHLPLGHDDFSRLPGFRDGVFFTNFREGRPGMQLERIPPYTGTLNPGWDPKLPLYRPLPMFLAFKAALAKGGPQPCPWDHLSNKPAPKVQWPAPTFEQAAFLGDRNSDVFVHLDSCGVQFAPHGQSSQARLLFVDGEKLDAATALRAKPGVASFLEGGGTLWVILRSQQASLKPLNALLPRPLSLTARTATALDRVGNSWVSQLTLDRLYFAEDEQDKAILKCGLAGPLPDLGKVLLTASNSDWSLFNGSPEDAKCGASVMYEQLKKPVGSALVEVPWGRGKIILSSVDYLPQTDSHLALWRDLLGLAGVKLGAARSPWLLPISGAPGTEPQWQYTEHQPEAGWMAADFSGDGWHRGHAAFGTDVPGGHPKTGWHTSDIWLRAEFQLPDANTQDIKLVLHHDDDAEVYVNGEEIFAEKGFLTKYETHPLDERQSKAFRPGRNVAAVHCHQTTGGQYIDVGFLRGNVVPDIPKEKKPHDLLLDGPIE